MLRGFPEGRPPATEHLDEPGGWLSRWTKPTAPPAPLDGSDAAAGGAAYEPLGGATPHRDPSVARSSVASVLPPDQPYMTRLKVVVVINVVVTIMNTVICSWFTYIAANGASYYDDCATVNPQNVSVLNQISGTEPIPTCDTWQFCLVYSDLLIERVDQKIFQGLTSVRVPPRPGRSTPRARVALAHLARIVLPLAVRVAAACSFRDV